MRLDAAIMGGQGRARGRDQAVTTNYLIVSSTIPPPYPTTIATYLLYIPFYIECTFDFRNVLLRNVLLRNILFRNTLLKNIVLENVLLRNTLRRKYNT